MEKLTSFFMKNIMLVNVLVLAIFFYGIYSVSSMNKEAFPDISFGNIIITTIYPGASAEDVEMNVTIPIEEALNGLTGIEEISSSSNEGLSIITVIADEDYNDAEFLNLYQEVDSEISKIDDLPEGIEGRPTLKKITSQDMPFMEIAFTGSYESLLETIPSIEKDLLMNKSISAIETIGLPDPEVHVIVDPEKAKRSYVGLRMIADSISNRNIEGSGGTFESFIGEKKIVSINKFASYKDVLDVNIRTSPDSAGYGIKVKDVASLKIEPKDEKLIVRNNGKRGATLILKKKKTGDVIKTSNEVRNYVSNIELPDGIEASIINDQSKMTRDRLGLTVNNAIMGFILVLLILFIVLDPKTAAWVAFGIPFSLFFVFIITYHMGMTLNAITLAAFIIVLGMLVDDAIVIAENYKHNTEIGMPRNKSAIEAVHTMWKPVLAACATTVMAFSPLLNFGGLPGKFIWAIPLVVLLSLTASLIESYFFLPVHLSHSKKDSKEIKSEKKGFIIKLEQIYEKFLRKTLKFKYFTVLILFLMVVFSIYIVKNVMEQDAMPQDAAEGFTVTFELPAGFTLNQTENYIKEFENILSGLPKNELVGFSCRIGTNSTSTQTDRGIQDNVASVFVYLTPFSERDRTVYEIIDSVKAKSSQLPIIKKSSVTDYELIRIGIPFGRPVEVKIVSNNAEKRMKTLDEVKEFLKDKNGILKYDDDIIEGVPEINIRPDYDLLSRTGLSVKDVLTVLRIAFDGVIVSDIRGIERTTDFRVTLKETGLSEKQLVKYLPVMNNQGRMINMGNLVTITDRNGAGEIKHYNGERTSTIYINFDKKLINGNDLINQIDEKFKNTDGVRIIFDGETTETNEIFSTLGVSAAIAIISVFLIISLIFNSYKKPFIILLALPFSIPGVIIAAFTHGHPMSMFIGVSIVGLCGIIVNDSIVMVHSISTIHGESKSGYIEAVVSAAKSRLRPILLTTLTTFLALIPTAYSIGGFDPFITPMCLGLAWGLLYSTLITLILVPIFYSIGQDIETVKKKVFTLHPKKYSRT